MANEIGLSQLAGSLPNVIRSMALMARYDAAEIYKHVLNADADVQKWGDRVTLPILPKFSVNAVGTGGTVTRQQLSLTTVSILVDQWDECTVDVEDRGEVQSAIDVLKSFSSQFGEALADTQDQKLAALHSSITTNTVGDTANPTPLDDAMVRLGRLKLDKTSIPKRDRFWLLSPDAESDLLSQARFSEAQNTGLARGVQIEGGRLTKLYGDPVYVANQIKTSGSVKKNIYCQKECLGIATQRNFKLIPLAKVQLSSAVTAHIIHGEIAVRQAHGVVVNTSINTDA